jgi:DNA (cytosine-5)-methyltransferase 3A
MNTVTARGRDKCNIWIGGTSYRYLHPVEAERLQTLPDNYTDVLKSDAKRIKAIGNGWTVDVIAHIFSGLANGKN